MTAAKTMKTLSLDSTDLKWLSEQIEKLGVGNFRVEQATLRADFLDHTFKVKRRSNDLEDDLVLTLSVPA